jgi:hypothetical protein
MFLSAAAAFYCRFNANKILTSNSKLSLLTAAAAFFLPFSLMMISHLHKLLLPLFLLPLSLTIISHYANKKPHEN